VSEVRYKIVFNGLVMMETPEETVKANMARLFKCDLARIEPLFSGDFTVLKRNLDEQKAVHYVHVLRNAGAIVHMEHDQPDKPVVAPVAPVKLELVEKAEPVEPAWAQARSQEQEQRPDYKSPSQALAEHQALQNSRSYLYCDLNIISLEGRLGRLRYFAWSAAVYLLLLTVGGVGFLLSTKLPSLTTSLATLAGWIGVVISMASSFVLTFRRLHDLGKPAWYMLIWLIPGPNLAFSLYLLLWAGDDGENDYGLPPPPNNIGVVLLAGCGVLVSIALVFSVFYPAQGMGKVNGKECQTYVCQDLDKLMKNDPEFRRIVENDPEIRWQIERIKKADGKECQTQACKDLDEQTKNNPKSRLKMETDPKFRQQVERMKANSDQSELYLDLVKKVRERYGYNMFGQ
jgi:uncharacterized membrane protein YhaH (DUF805 family)